MAKSKAAGKAVSKKVNKPPSKVRLGRPPSAIRERLRGDFEEQIQTLKEIASGKNEVTVVVNAVLSCQHCGKRSPSDMVREAIQAAIQEGISQVAKPSDRVKAIDLLGKYGLGQAKDLDPEKVQQALAMTIQIILRRLGPEEAEPLLAEIEPLW